MHQAALAGARRIVTGMLGASGMVAVAVLCAPSSTRAEVIERVVVVVNDDAIFLSELRQRAVPYVVHARSRAERERTYARVLEDLIDQSLVEQAAAVDEITVTDADVNRAIETVRERSGIESWPLFWRVVAEQGFGAEAEYRAEVRAQLLRFRVLDARIGGRANITEDDVRRRYDERARREAVGPYESVRTDLFGELRQEALARQTPILFAELRRAAIIERRL